MADARQTCRVGALNRLLLISGKCSSLEDIWNPCVSRRHKWMQKLSSLLERTQNNRTRTSSDAKVVEKEDLRRQQREDGLIVRNSTLWMVELLKTRGQDNEDQKSPSRLKKRTKKQKFGENGGRPSS
ncbi:hypothetical protein M514_28247, partial [Trichuris suis]